MIQNMIKNNCYAWLFLTGKAVCLQEPLRVKKKLSEKKVSNVTVQEAIILSVWIMHYMR